MNRDAVTFRVAASMPPHASRTGMLRQLVLVKALFLRGRGFTRSTDAISRMLAIHVFDNVVEMMLVTVAAHQGKQPKREKTSVPELLNLVNPPLKKQLLALHERRNGVHHGGDIPTHEDAIKYEGYTEDFLRAESEDISGIAFDALSLADLIENEELKVHIKKVEEALGCEAYRVAIPECDVILTNLVIGTSDIFGKAGQLTGHFAGGDEFQQIITSEYVDQFADKDWYEFAKDTSKAFLQLGQASTAMQFLDNLRSDFLEFRRLADGIDRIPESELKDSAHVSLDFVVKVILKWQEEHLI